MAQAGKGGGDLESEVWNAIAAFEQILEAMPDDRSSLETLAHAYEHIGDQTRARDYLVRLGHVLLKEGDKASAAELRDKLSMYEGDDDVAELLERIDDVAPQAPSEAPPADGASAEAAGTPVEADADAEPDGQEGAMRQPIDASRLAFRVADELSLAWALFEAGELTQEEYASVAQDLSEMSTGRRDLTVSVMHVLENRAFRNLERVLAYVSKTYSAPIVSLHCFDVQADAARLLPFEFIVRRGAFVFEAMKKDALVAVVNPADQRLRSDVEAVSGKHCHFYATLASEFDSAIARIKDELL